MVPDYQTRLGPYGERVRALLPSAEPDPDLHEWYGRDWLETGGVRVNFVSAVDGAAQADGKSRGLQTPGDNRVFAALRDLADVVLVGAGTAVAEGYKSVHFSERRLAVRASYGLPAALPVAVMSRTLRLDPAHPLFTDAPADERTIVLTCDAAPDAVRTALREVADVVSCGADTVEPQRAVAALSERGLRRILCEGGPSALGDLAGAGVVDELCLTLSPLLGGPGAGRIVSGDPWPGSSELQLVSLLEEDGALFLRYRMSG